MSTNTVVTSPRKPINQGFTPKVTWMYQRATATKENNTLSLLLNNTWVHFRTAIGTAPAAAALAVTATRRTVPVDS
uniref:Uncharacterized protein n=1 Tax=Anopheles funestus TaxID=62324 RepID=A0A182S488_ANOFN